MNKGHGHLLGLRIIASVKENEEGKRETKVCMREDKGTSTATVEMVLT